MSLDTDRRTVAETMERINEAWRAGDPERLAPLVHSDVAMVMPGFAARSMGREPFLAGFRDVVEQATLHDFEEQDRQVDGGGDAAVVSYRYAMVYDRAGRRYRAAGRDLWVLHRVGGSWLAVWRTMLGAEDHPL